MGSQFLTGRSKIISILLIVLLLVVAIGLYF